MPWTQIIRKKPSWHTVLGLVVLLVFSQVGSNPAAANHLSRGFRATGVEAIDRATAAYHNGNLNRAVNLYTRAINSGRLGTVNLAIAYFDRGVVFSDLGDHNQAIADYSQAIALKPDEPDFYNNRGNSFHLLGENDTAIQDYDEAIFLDPDFAFAFYNRGAALADLGAYAEAVEDFNTALSFDQELAIAYWGRGRVFRIVGNFNQALTDYISANDLDPDLDVFLNVGWIYTMLGDYQTAEDIYASLCAQGCDLWEALGRYAALSRFDDAAKDQLAGDIARLDRSVWPGPVADFVLGNIGEGELLSVAGNFDPAQEREQLTFANYFVGHERLLGGDTAAADSAFQTTLDQNLPNWIQNTAARQELQTLRGNP